MNTVEEQFVVRGIGSLEIAFHQGHRLQSFSRLVGRSSSTITRVAFAAALQTYLQNDSITFAFQSFNQKWTSWQNQLSGDGNMLRLIRGERSVDFNKTQPYTDEGTRFFLSTLSLEQVCQAVDEEAWLATLRLSFPQVKKHKSSTATKETDKLQIEMLTTVAPDPFTGGLLLKCTYLITSFSEFMASSILGTIKHVLENIVLNPSIPLKHLELVSDRDYQQYRVWNQHIPAAAERCVHHMIRDSVLVHPQRPAVDAWDGQLSYAELEEASIKVAYQLSQRGIGLESTVALLFEKTMWYVVANVAVLKAGGTFVPLDPAQPKDRLLSIVQKTKAKVILSSRTQALLAAGLSESTVYLDKALIQETSVPEAWTANAVSPWNLAYIMFTSGSTGNPKGVMIEHVACCSSAMHHGRATGMSPQTRALQFSRPTFDASIAEVLTTLIHGGCVVVPSDEQRMNDITAVVRDKRANWAFITPSLARLLDPADVPGLQTLLIGGEAVGQDSINAWAPGRNLISGYGPTENTVFCVLCPLPAHAKAGLIGRGVGSLCWIADPENPNRLLPPGATGELLVEGPQLARGYLGFGEGEGPNVAFIRDPPWLVKLGRRGRLYRTGDLCRFDHNGSVYYESRKDTQLKISGQRLEAGEVEHHLRLALGTAHVAVNVINRPGQSSEDASPGKALVAFVCTKEVRENELAVDSKFILPQQDLKLAGMLPQVEIQLAKTLPSWMMPSIYIPLFAIPLSVNGKADLKRLRAEAASLTPQQFSSFMLLDADTMVNSNESLRLRTMRGLWAAVLGVDTSCIATKSSFFRLGGDSMTAMRLVVAARKAGIGFTVADVFRSPVLEDLCELSAHEVVAGPRLELQPFELVGGSSNELLREISQECAVPVEDIEDAFPCTPLQQGFMARSSAGSKAYFAQNVLHLGEHVDLERLKAAWQSVAQAHGILRTRIVNALGAGLLQVVVKGDLTWHESLDLGAYLESDLQQPPDFGVPLNRLGIVYNSNGRPSALVWTAHHAVTDGHSVGLTLRAVRDAYDGNFHASNPPFTAFIQHINSLDADATACFWRSRFQGGKFAPFPKLPSPSYSPNPRSYVFHTLTAPPTNLGVTTSTILRAAWALMMSLFTGSDDVVFGITSAGRNGAVQSLESIFGPTIATVPLRIRCGRGTSVQQFLTDTQTSAIDMIPFEQAGLPSIAHIDADCHTACGFQSIMIAQPDVDMATGDSVFKGYERPQDLEAFNEYAIMVECCLRKGGVNINVNYDNLVVGDDELRRLVDYFEAAVEFLCSEQTQTIENFFARPTATDIATIKGWNKTEPYTADACIHHLFEKQVHSQPNAQAIFAWDGCLSFAELDYRASKLARRLVNLGVGPEVRVPYCFEKSIFAAVAMLAILKAGGTMVPLDPEHPQERTEFIIENTGARIVTTSAAHKFESLNLHVVTVDEDLFRELERSNTIPFSSQSVQPTNAATVLFTSGSTGTPKGVVQEHKTLCSAAHAHSKSMQMHHTSRILQFSAHVFDVSIIEIVNAFILGACLCTPSEDDRTSNLAAFVARSRADWAFFTPSFAATLRPADLPGLKTLAMGGEAVDQESVVTWSKHVTLINAYGPCEASVCTTGNLSDGSTPSNSIGRGANCLVWLVDQQDHDRLVPIGSVGEIVLEGPNVARGYEGDDEKTSKSFVYNPKWMAHFEPALGRRRRVYKTGDLGRFNADGTIVYLGRKDTQVKIRGQRVELGEIEHHLVASLPEGSAAVVDALVVPGTACNKTLVAFVQLGRHGEHSQGEQSAIIEGLPEQLKQRLGAVLPVYMIPSVFIPIDKMPLTTTGKLNRKKLREYASSLSASDLKVSGRQPAHAQLLDDSEETAMAISSVLADLLSATSPEYGDRLRGRNFNPYQAGMDSIQVISLAAFVRRTYGVSLAVQNYMDSKATIRNIAELIDAEKQGSRARGCETGGLDFLEEIEKYDAALASLPLPQTITPPKKIPEIFLLTGATGFLGNQILAQLLQRRETRKVIAIVRGHDAAHAADRLLSISRSTTWWRDECAARIEVWHGDLAALQLGLDDTQWARLCGLTTVTTMDTDAETIDAIIHNGAIVNWLADYAALTPANILSTVALLTAVLEAAAAPSCRPVPRFTYISGGHLSTAPDEMHSIARQMATPAYPGYSQTKFVAENLVARFAGRIGAGAASWVSIVKPGLVLGDAVHGIANTDDFLWRVAASALDVGGYNGEERREWMTAAGVDLVANIVLDCCFGNEDGSHQGVVRKILSGLTVGDFWDTVVQETGRSAEAMDTAAWLEAIQESVKATGQTHRLWPVMHLLEEKRGKLGQPLNRLSKAEQEEHRDAVRTALRKSLQYLVALRYLQSPSESTSSDEEGRSMGSSLLSASSVFTRTPTMPAWERLGGRTGKDVVSTAVNLLNHLKSTV